MRATTFALLLVVVACRASQPKPALSVGRPTAYPDVTPNAEAARLATLRTFTLADGPGVISQPRADLAVRSGIARHLVAKGYQLPTTGAPDFVVRYALVSRKTQQVNHVVYGYRGPFAGGAAHVTRSTPIDEGSLMIELINTKNGRRIWRSYAVGAARNVDEALFVLESAVRDLLAPLPYRRH